MSEFQNLSMADLLALTRQAGAALKSLKDAREAEFGDVIHDAVLDVITVQGDPGVTPTSGTTGWSEKSTLTIDGTEYAVSVWISPVLLNAENKKKFAESPEGKAAAAKKLAAKV